MKHSTVHIERERWRLLGLGGLALAFMVGDALVGGCAGILHLAPFFALLLPLLVGRYVGEGVLLRLRRGPAPARRAASRVALRPPRVDRSRPRVLWDLALASRPPPATF